MAFPLVTILRWVLPAIPELISSVRSFQAQRQAPLNSSVQNDPQGRIENLEKALDLQSRINEGLTSQLQRLRKRLQILTFVAFCGFILAVVAIAVGIRREDHAFIVVLSRYSIGYDARRLHRATSNAESKSLIHAPCLKPSIFAEWPTTAHTPGVGGEGLIEVARRAIEKAPAPRGDRKYSI
jgi:hypothetical protein